MVLKTHILISGSYPWNEEPVNTYIIINLTMIGKIMEARKHTCNFKQQYKYVSNREPARTFWETHAAKQLNAERFNTLNGDQ